MNNTTESPTTYKDYDYTRTARNGRWEVLRASYVWDGRSHLKVGERVIGSEATEGAALRKVLALRERTFAALNGLLGDQ